MAVRFRAGAAMGATPNAVSVVLNWMQLLKQKQIDRASVPRT
jgi:hypothetical protein